MVENIDMYQELDELIINFLNLNKDLALTPESLLKRIKIEIQNPNILEYLQKYIEGILNRLAFSYKIDMHEHEGKMYFMKLRSEL